MERARKLWTRAREQFARIGIPLKVKKYPEWLDGLPLSKAKVKRGTSGKAKVSAKAGKKAIAKPKGTGKSKNA